MKQVGGQRNVGHARDGARLAVVERFEFGEFIRVFEDEIADAPDEFAAFARRQAAPRTGFERAARGRDGAVDVFLVAVGHAGDDRSVGGLNTSKVLPDAAGTHLPPIRLCLGLVSHLATAGLIAVADRLAGAWPFPAAMRDTLSVRALVRRREMVVFIWLILFNAFSWNTSILLGF